RRQFPQRRAARRGALHTQRRRHDHVRGHARGPEGLRAAVDDPDAALPQRRARSAARERVLPVRRGRGQADRRPAPGAGSMRTIGRTALLLLAATSVRAQTGAEQNAARPLPATTCPLETAAFHPCALERAKTFKPPRTADGKPDFGGYWRAQHNGAAYDVE